MNACSVPIPPGVTGASVARLCHLHEQDVPRRLRYMEGPQKAPDHGEAEAPVARLPEGDATQVARPRPQDAERLAEVLPEVANAPVDPHSQRRQSDQEPDDDDA